MITTETCPTCHSQKYFVNVKHQYCEKMWYFLGRSFIFCTTHRLIISFHSFICQVCISGLQNLKDDINQVYYLFKCVMSFVFCLLQIPVEKLLLFYLLFLFVCLFVSYIFLICFPTTSTHTHAPRHKSAFQEQ